MVDRIDPLTQVNAQTIQIRASAGTRPEEQLRMSSSLATIAMLLLAVTATAQSTFMHFEGKQTSPIRLSADNSRLFAVNTPDARVSVFDLSDPSNPILIAEIPVGIEPVSVNPRSSDEAWVVNEVSDSVSVVSVSLGIVTDTLPAKDEPADVVFARDRAFVTASRSDQIHVFDTTTHELLATVALPGNNPRALVASLDDTKVFAAFALSGNRTTIIPARDAPAPPAPLLITNEPPRTGLIVDVGDTNWSSILRYTMPDNDVAEIDAQDLRVTRCFSGVGTINLGMAAHPVTGDLYVANTAARNRVRFEPALRGHVVQNQITRIDLATGVATPFDLNAGIDPFRSDLQARVLALAQPAAMVFHPSGSLLYVAAFGSDLIGVMDNAGHVVGRIELNPVGRPQEKRGPRGLALHAPANRLYVLNRISNTIMIVNPTTRVILREVPVGSHDPTPQTIRAGRGFLYDARLSGNGQASCAACHVDADMDHLAWDLGDPSGAMQEVRTSLFLHELHPMKGPMTTQTLRGLKDEHPFHWRGDRTNFLHFNLGFQQLLGGSALTGEDMLAFEAFVNTLVFQPNPNQTLDGSPPAILNGGDPVAGRVIFHTVETNNQSRSCANCHQATPVPLSQPEILPVSLVNDFQPFKVPHLRNFYQKHHFDNAIGARSAAGFGISHDGADPDLSSMLPRHSFRQKPLNEQEVRDLNAFMLCFDTGTPAAVGHTLTLNAANLNDPQLRARWATLERLAATNIDLIATGALNRGIRGAVYIPNPGRYLADKKGMGSLSREDIEAAILAGGSVTFMGVPRGSGVRMGIDRDLDGVLNGDTPSPELRATRLGANINISWSASPAAFLLESSSSLAPNDWKPEKTALPMEAASLTFQPSESRRFFRLRGL